MKVLLVIPAYNEEKSIVHVVEEVQQAGYDYVVINDGSTDRTRDVCIQHGVNLISLSRNLGIGGAVQTGHRYAYEQGYDIDIQVDGDGQHDISFVPRLVEQVEAGADLVIGSRFLETSNGFQSTSLRRAGIHWLSFLLRRHYKTLVTDPTSGFRASGPKAVKLFSRTYPMDYPEPESIAEALNRGLNVSEVPVEMRERAEGKSSIGPASSVYYMIKVSLAILIASMKRKSEERGE